MSKRILAMLLALVMTAALFTVGAAAAGFADVPDGEYYSEPVAWALEQKITNGTSPTTFSPMDTCTRGQIVTFLWRSEGEPEPQGSANPFSDVMSGAYYQKAVLWAVENGITNGTSDTTFSPELGCTRGQVVTFLYRAQGEPDAATSGRFTDVHAGDYFADAVNWAAESGITLGTSETLFSPEQTCTRGQIVTFLWRYAQNRRETPSFSGTSGDAPTIYAIADLKLDGTTACATVNTDAAATLTIAVLDENTEQVLSQQSVTTPALCELTEIKVPLSALPATFLLRADLKSADGSLLCQPYYALEYTAMYRDFKDKDVEDFDDATVINFDGDTATNFGVLADDVRYVPSDAGADILRVERDENNVAQAYRVSSPSAKTQALKAGDGVLMRDEEGVLQLFRIRSVEKQKDGTLVFMPVTGGQLIDYYQYIDLHLTFGEQDGLVDATVLSAETDEEARPMRTGVSKGKHVSESINIDFTDLVYLEGTVDVTATVDVVLEYNATFYNFSQTMTTTTEVSFKLKCSNASNEWDDTSYSKVFEVKLAKIPIPVPNVPGLVLSIQASVPVELTASVGVGLTASYQKVTGYRVNSKSGLENVYQKDFQSSFEARSEVTLQAGPKIALVGSFCEGALQASISASFGIKVKGALAAEIPLHPTASSIHACDKCIDGSAVFYVSVIGSFQITLIKNLLEYHPHDWEITAMEFPVRFLNAPDSGGKFFISLENEKESPYHGRLKFGSGSCENNKYRLELQVKDSDGKAIAGNSVRIEKDGKTVKTVSAPAAEYLYGGTYQLIASASGYRTEKKACSLDKGTAKVTIELLRSGTVTGTVKDARTGKLLSGVDVTISDGKYTAGCRTDANGVFTSGDVIEGTYTVSFALDGYKPAGTTVSITPKLAEVSTGTILLEQKTDWLEAYAKKLQESGSSVSFALVYLDDNEIPELVISRGSFHAAAAYIYTYHNDKLVDLGGFGDYGQTNVAVRQGMIWLAHSINGGYYIQYLHQLSEGSVSVLRQFEEDASTTTVKYKVDGKSVTASVYKEQVQQAYNQYDWTKVSYSSSRLATTANINALLKDYTQFVVS